MLTRQKAIETLEAWARFHHGCVKPGDSEAAAIVELALASFGEAKVLRDLLMYVYGADLLPETFDVLEKLAPLDRATVRDFLLSLGWKPTSLATASIRRFVRFLEGRL